MFTNTKLAKSIQLAIAFGAVSGLSLSAAAVAQETEEAKAQSVEKIEITGSRIKRTDMEGANPVTTITAEDIGKMSVTSVGDLLQNLSSSAGAAVNTQTNNGGDSTTRFSLRGLGASRTLVLLNGRRIVSGGAGANSSVDLNMIPTAIVKRVEVLKDGASATYGSDAIAGVVNIITKNDFEGFEATVHKFSSDKGDAESKGFDLTFGASGDKGNVVATIGLNNQSDAFMGDRDFSEFELRAYEDGSTQQGGSSAPPWVNANTADGRVTRGPDYGDWRAYDGGTDSYNYNPVNYLQTPSTRRYASIFANYELGELGFLGDVNTFAEVNYTQTKGNRLIAPEPLAPLIFFGSAAPYSANNYYNQAFGPSDANGEAYTIDDWRRRMLETGGRANERDYKTIRTAFGINGVLDNGWEYEVSYVWGQNDSVEKAQGYFNLDRVAEAVGPTGWLDSNGSLIVDSDGSPVVNTNGSDLVCLNADDSVISGCVPLNIFGTPGTENQISSEMLQYISGDYNTTETGQNKQEVLSAVISGDLFDLTAGTIGFAAGYEKRTESGSYTPDALILQGTTTAGSAVGTVGGYEVEELYAEFIVPLLSGIQGAELLDLELAMRHSDYDSFGTNNSGKIGVKWMPNNELLVRATYSEAFRAPSTSALFGGASVGFPEAVDPCDGDSYTTEEYTSIVASSNFANCVATGVPAVGYSSGGVEQVPTNGGGASNWNGAVTLTPEQAEITTIGFVYNPDLIENFSASLDYWKIELTNAISSVGTQVRLDNCFENGTYCSSINRFGAGSPAVGGIITVDNYAANVGGITTGGVDFDLRYAFDTEYGSFGVGFDGTYLLEYDKELADGSIVDHVGRFEVDHDGMFSKLKTNLSINWSIADFDTSLSASFIDSVTETEKGWWAPAGFERTVESNTVVDLQTNYYATENLIVTVGVDNMFDETPPFVFSAFGANTDVATYNVIGRSVYARAKLSF
jgi:iron complex outermembrane recepter protein